LQKGLTLRVFEAIGAGKKLITTNQYIQNYSFYNPNNIYIINRENIKLEEAFFQNKYQEISSDLYQRLSIEGWLNCLFFEIESNIWINNIK
jgi:spermidine synthase